MDIEVGLNNTVSIYSRLDSQTDRGINFAIVCKEIF